MSLEILTSLMHIMYACVPKYALSFFNSKRDNPQFFRRYVGKWGCGYNRDGIERDKGGIGTYSRQGAGLGYHAGCTKQGKQCLFLKNIFYLPSAFQGLKFANMYTILSIKKLLLKLLFSYSQIDSCCGRKILLQKWVYFQNACCLKKLCS